MAWIESHQSLDRHPKLLRLAAAMGWSKNEAIGVLHRMWWWALEYAEDGDLGRYGEEAIQLALDIDASKPFFTKAVECGFLDADFKIHDWIHFAGNFLTRKYHTNNLPLLKKIWARHGYKYGKGNGKFGHIQGSRKEVKRKLKGSLPNLTKPNLTKPINTPPTPQGNLQEWVPQEAWFGFLEMREQKKKKPTARAIKIILDKLNRWRQRGHDPTEILNTATVNGWTDVYEPKAQGVKNGAYQRDNQTTRTAAGGIRGDASVYDAVTERFIDEGTGSG